MPIACPFHRQLPDCEGQENRIGIPSILMSACNWAIRNSDSWKLLLNPCTKTKALCFFVLPGGLAARDLISPARRIAGNRASAVVW